MFLTNYDDPYILSDAVLLVILGIIGVFIALIALMMIVKAIGARKKEPAAAADTLAVPAPPMTPSAAAPAKAPAPGSQGEIDLFNVDDRTAAMLMAIVADDLKAPLNTLRFTSIREVR